MPSEIRAVELGLPEAEPLADLHGVAQDLALSIHLCETAIRLEEGEQPDRVVVEGLVTAALIRYFRCFSGSPRLGLRHTDIPRLGKRVNTLHTYFKALRDKFVAHCVNPFEETWVTAMATVRDGERQPLTALGHSGHRMMLSAAEASRIKFLAERVDKLVKQRIVREETKVLRLAQRLPLEFIHDSNLRSPSPLQLTDVHRSRRQTVVPPPRSIKTPSKRRAG